MLVNNFIFIYIYRMVKFKLFNNKENKFTSIYFGPKKLYKIRYQLGIWNNTANDESLKKIYDLVKRDNRFQLHFKFNSIVLLNVYANGNFIITT